MSGRRLDWWMALLLVTSACVPRASDGEGDTGQALRAHMEALAGDAAEGRGVGRPGLERAIRYAVEVMEAAGARPIVRGSDGRRSFLQPVPLVRYRLGAGSAVTLAGPGGSRVLSHGSEMIVLDPGPGSGSVDTAAPVFVGFGISEPERGWDDYAGLDVRGRVVFMLEGVGSPVPAGLLEEYQDRRVGPERILQAAVDHGVAAILIIPGQELYQRWDALAGTRAGDLIVSDQAYAGAPSESPIPVAVLRDDVVGEVFAGRGYDPVHRTGAYARFELGGVRLGPELIRRLARSPTRRPVLFALFTAEEVGHFGSLHFPAEPPLAEATVVASLNFEHMGRSGDGTFLATASPAVAEVTRELLPAPLAGRLRSLALDPAGVVISGSDSYSFFLRGIPLIILGGGTFPEYHSPADDISLIDFDLLGDGVDIGEILTRRLADRIE